jgi:molybdopterin biosynthesis enzyme
LARAGGLLRVKSDVVEEINLREGFVIATLSDSSGVKSGQVLASVKIVSLSVEEARLREVEKILCDNKPVLEVVTPEVRSAGVIVVGTEVYEGRVKDAFLPILRKKLGDFGVGIAHSVVVPDEEEKVREKILEFKELGDEILLVCGGMAVDAGDITPQAIESTGAEVVCRGAPVFPGAMIMLAYLDDIPVVGLPACVIPDERTSFDLILPKLLVKERIQKKEIAELGHGGLL